MTLDRRRFIQAGCYGLGAALMGMPTPAKTRIRPAARGKAQPIGSARNLIFVFLEGGPSQVDTFDLKRGAWTPDILGPQKIGTLDWPAGVMPKLAAMTDKFSLVRSLSAAEAAHSRAIYHLVAAHRQNPDLVRDVPHFASMLAYKFQDQRGPSQTLPSFVMVGETPAQNGFLPIQNAPLKLKEDGRINDLKHYWSGEQDRFSLLETLRKASYNDPRDNYRIQQQESRAIMLDSGVADFFGGDPTENDPNVDPFLKSCQSAVKVLEADLGTRFLQLQLGSWDHHFDIYSEANFGLPKLCQSLDSGLSYLITQMEQRPGRNGGSLLDETLIVAVGEFGRTVAALNTDGGRDHHHYLMPAFFAGGGVKGGRVIGATDPRGEFILDRGWSHPREMQPEDLIATLYSALGVDWTERFTNTRSGRPFELVETNRVGEVFHIDALFV